MTNTETKIHILAPRGHYIAQVRRPYHRLWKTIGNKSKTAEDALRWVAKNMAGMGRGRVLFIDENTYYEPNLVFEVRRI
jgi:hypothetical protein